MKFRGYKKGSKRTPRVVYATGAPKISDAVLFVNPKDGNIDRAYLSDGIRGTNNSSYPGCTEGSVNYAPPSNSQRRRYCHIAHTINSYYKIGYEYYEGHRYSINEVIQRGGGNCCDVSRLVNELATETLECTTKCGGQITEAQYVVCGIIYNGTLYQHIYNELLVDGEWLIFDGVSQLLKRNCREVFGQFQGVISRIPNSNTAPCG